MSKCSIIALCNQKGGVGKTTTTLNLGVGLARCGKKVLLIDSDPQGSLTAALGWRNTDELSVTLTDIYTMILQDRIPDADYGILHSSEGVDLTPCSITLSNIEMSVMNSMCRETLLKRYLDVVRSHYDYILIDCLPTLSIIVQNALTAATNVIIPTQAQFLSTKGLEQLIRTIYAVKKGLNPTLVIDGILFTMVERKTVCSKELMQLLRGQYGERNIGVFDTEIPKTVRFQEASLEGKSIYMHDTQGKGAQAFEALVAEVTRFHNP